MTIRPGLNKSSLAIDSPSLQDINFGTQYNFRLGIEAEFVFPFNKNKWSAIIEPTYQYYKSEITKKDANASGGIINVNFDYKSIELPIGVRHYFFLKNGFKIFANISYIIDFSSKKTIDFTRFDGSVYQSLNIDSRNNLALGAGIKYKDKFSLEMRIHTNRELLESGGAWTSDYKTASIIFGYSLF